MTSTFGDRVTSLLKQQHMTQKELAAAIDITEVSMTRYVRGDRTPNATTVAKIAGALRTSSDYLLGNEYTEDPETEFHKLYRSIARNAHQLTLKQKRILIDALLAEDD